MNMPVLEDRERTTAMRVRKVKRDRSLALREAKQPQMTGFLALLTEKQRAFALQLPYDLEVGDSRYLRR